LAAGSRRPLGFEHGDAGLTGVNRYEDLLLQVGSPHRALVCLPGEESCDWT
jgi:hypothetical protein